MFLVLVYWMKQFEMKVFYRYDVGGTDTKSRSGDDVENMRNYGKCNTVANQEIKHYLYHV